MTDDDDSQPRDLYHGLTYAQHHAVMVQIEDGSWRCYECEARDKREAALQSESKAEP